MTGIVPNILVDREQMLLEAMQPLVPDLMEIDPAYYGAFFLLGRAPELEPAVDAVIGRHFRPGLLQFVCTGEVESSWQRTARVALDFEFSCDGIFAFFRLLLSAQEPAVSLHFISFPGEQGNPQTNNRRLEAAIRAGVLA